MRVRVAVPTKREIVACIVRDMIADGTLKPGDRVPSALSLARRTGFAANTCQEAMRSLLADGMLTRGVSRNARLRVARPGAAGAAPAGLGAELSKSLAARRHAAGLTQAELAGKLGVSDTTVGHAETGRLWHSRDFWLWAGRELGDGGELLRLYERYRAAAQHGRAEEAGGAAREEGVTAGGAAPVLPLSVTVTAEGVTVTWPGGTEIVVRPPGWQAGEEARD